MNPVQFPQTGVCIVRVEIGEESLLITLTMNRNLDRYLYSARSEPAQQFSDVETALAAVGKFVRNFVWSHPAD